MMVAVNGLPDVDNPLPLYSNRIHKVTLSCAPNRHRIALNH